MRASERLTHSDRQDLREVPTEKASRPYYVEYMPSDGMFRPCIWIQLHRRALAIFIGWGEGWPRFVWL